MNASSFSALLALALPCCCHGTVLSNQVDALFSRWDRQTTPGAAVVVIRAGAVIHMRGYGMANLEQQTSISPQTVFDVASVAKQFTGVALARLVEQGKLSLDDDVRKYLPDLPDFGSPITLRHLVHHTSGLRDWPESLQFSGMAMEDAITLDRILEMVRRQRELDFPPGQEHLYSNTGYNLLAAVITKITGQSFRQWTDTHLFKPLRMQHTHFCEDPAALIPRRADSYAPGPKREYRRVISQLAAAGSSSLFISAEDMATWLLHFEDDKLCPPTLLQAIHTPGRLANGKEVRYGFGVGLSRRDDTDVYAHTGGWAGYRSVTLRIPARRLAVAILSNAADMDTLDLANQIAALYLLPDSPHAAEKTAKDSSDTLVSEEKIKSTSMDDFTGTYRLGANWWLTITCEGKKLFAQATGESKVPLSPRSPTNFFVQAYGAGIEFVRDDTGTVTHLNYRGIRAPKRKSALSTPGHLGHYAGDYWSDELGALFRIEPRDQSLFTWHPVGGWLRLNCWEGDRFDTAARTTVDFTRATNGVVDGLKVSGSRVRNVRFQRLGIAPPIQSADRHTAH